ncbi:unnamed protein product [Parnassius mnemosyne]|uniref:Fe2OG dioxygenase domain-containing protein n=2 Tax=Parnassius mnemosyne TaxID=213953 RepID=A0AAV1KK38_9NEOP
MERTFIKPENENSFMQVFKYYKCNKPKPSLDNVLSLENKIFGKNQIGLYSAPTLIEDLRTELLGLTNVKEWKAYTLLRHPGLILIKNPFTSLGQRYWIRKCLEQYSKKPNKTNIDTEMVLNDWWKECFKSGHCNSKLQNKLRWTTLGYHHNWDTKVYTEDNKSLFPEDLAELCDCISKYLGYQNFRAEAAIVNYYHIGSTLSAHTDHSEVNLEAPLFSFSFGQSAIFLIGGPDKNFEPSAIMLNSGDVAVMSKEARLSYHAVPKIVSALSQPWSNGESDKEICDNMANLKYITDRQQLILDMNRNIDNKEWNLFKNYIQESRINMNVRQVLHEHQKSLLDVKFFKSYFNCFLFILNSISNPSILTKNISFVFQS